MRRSMKFEGLETRKLMTADVGLTAPVDDVEYVQVAREEEPGNDIIRGEDESRNADDAEQWHGFLSDVAIWNTY